MVIKREVLSGVHWGKMLVATKDCTKKLGKEGKTGRGERREIYLDALILGSAPIVGKATYGKSG